MSPSPSGGRYRFVHTRYRFVLIHLWPYTDWPPKCKALGTVPGTEYVLDKHQLLLILVVSALVAVYAVVLGLPR